jgi:hypothetical protein
MSENGEGVTLESLLRSLDELKEIVGAAAQTPAPLPVAPAATQGIEDAATPAPSRAIMSAGDMYAMRQMLKQKSTGELHAMFAMQAVKTGSGIPLDAWLMAGGASRYSAYESLATSGVDPQVQKLLDTTGGSALIRQDLEPILYELFVRQCPAWDRISKEPANGLMHTYQQVTSFGGAEFMGELGTVTDDKSTYERQTTNVAIVATRRGVTLKNLYAAQQSGSGFNPESLELNYGLRAIAKKMQDQIFSGHSTDSGGTANNELGLYDANGFTGLRALLNSARAKNVDPATDPTTNGSLRRALANAAVEVMQQGGGAPSIIWANPLEIETFGQQQEDKQRWPGPAVAISPGTEVDGVMTPFGRLALGPVPGTSIASYTSTAYSGYTVRDMYLLDESSISMPYLGSEGPTVLDIPIGIAGQLTHLYVIFGMWGLAVKAPIFSNKVRVKVSA